jgi:hypothetical protein
VDESKLAPIQAAEAERVCGRAVDATRNLSRHLAQALAGNRRPDAVGSQLVAPGIRILNRESSQLEPIQAASSSVEFDAYVGLFQPIIELAEQRLEAGLNGEPERGQALERLIAGLTDEQVAIAKRLKLAACGIGFTEALGGRR